jgi:hypothetical protein
VKTTAVVVALLAAAGTAGAASPTRSVVAPAPVTALAADGDRVAYASGATAADCDRIRVWSRRTGRPLARLGRTTHCEETSTGRGIAALSIAGRRVLWLHYVGGNIREWSLFTATTTAPRPRRIAFFERDVDAPAPVVVGDGDVSRSGNQLPYAVGREVRVLGENGGRHATWTEAAAVTALAARSGGVIVATADGRVSVREQLDWNDVVLQWTAEPAASGVFFADLGVVAQRGRRLEFRDGSGRQRSYMLPAGARVVDAASGTAVYIAGGRAKLIALQTGRTRDLGPAAHAQLEVLTAIRAAGRVIRASRFG